MSPAGGAEAGGDAGDCSLTCVSTACCQVEASKQVLGVTVRTFSCGLQSQERHLADIQHQLEEAHRLEENMKRDLKRISKDIDVLQRQDLDVRNEISTQKKKFLHQRSVQVQTNVTIICI